MSKVKKRRPVYGVGLNDYEYPVHFLKDGKISRCQFYSVWIDILKRCYDKKCQEKQPTYAGCSIVAEWLSFKTFREWMQSQPWNGNQIDKDILIKGNKVYGPDTCVFISKSLNLFISGWGNKPNGLPLGVCFDSKNNKYRAQCKNYFTGKNEALGRFRCEFSAHSAWKNKKKEMCLAYAAEQSDPRVVKSLLDIYSELSKKGVYVHERRS